MTNSLIFNRYFVISTLVLGLSFLAPQAQAGPWTEPAGSYYIKVGESFYMADGYRNAQGETITGAQYFSATTSSYFQVGLLEDLHIQGYIPLVAARNSMPGADNSTFDVGFGDATIGIQASPFNLSFPSSIRLDIKAPLYRGYSPGDQNFGAPARGDGQVDLTGWLSAGGGLDTIPLYFFLDIGYQHRTAWSWNVVEPPAYSDSIVSFAQAGYWIADTLLIAWNTSALIALYTDTVSKSYITSGPSLYLPIGAGFALEADGYMTPYSRNSGTGWSAGIGISYKPQSP